MWLKWLPWRFIIRNVAQKKGFLDPLTVFSHLERFSQPSEVAAPVELLRSGAVMHARGLINSQAIQHNLDWVWPYWVERQFNPYDKAFVPRAFSITHINLTHRNWTAVGLPGMEKYPIIDPCGLVTPFFDGWSIDAWIIPEQGNPLIPSRIPSIEQKLVFEDNLEIITESNQDGKKLSSRVYVEEDAQGKKCHIQLKGYSQTKGWIVVSLRPYNPEGISFINSIELLEGKQGWRVNKKYKVSFCSNLDNHIFSSYHNGDVYAQLSSLDETKLVKCDVGMATAAALFEIKPSGQREINLEIPLVKMNKRKEIGTRGTNFSEKWKESLQNVCQMRVPDKHFQFLYDTALRTMVLHSPKDVYPGPYTYRRFWFRDAAFILNAMLCVGLKERVKKCIDGFSARQTPLGYFLSQEGEWDSNGEALWMMQRYCELTNSHPEKAWQRPIHQGGLWITRKRLSEKQESLHAGLFPAGFSAEHLGPNNYYYWDDFWGIAGLKAAGFLEDLAGHNKNAEYFYAEAKDFMRCIEHSLVQVEKRLERSAMPASPYRRLDAGTIGSLAVGYPLQLWEGKDRRLKDTINFLIQNCLVNGGFFQDMTHSGINPYLTLHMAQVLLRAGDQRYFALIKSVADLASPTGQWPEAIHPHTKGGCMGDGQHVWAAAEWILMMRNCFVLEEQDRLVLCAGVPDEWVNKKEGMSFGPTLTKFGVISVFIDFQNGEPRVRWEGQWFKKEPEIVMRDI